MAFLTEYLSAGAKDSGDIERAAEALSISRATLRRAREELHVHVGRKGRGSIWSLAKTDDADE
jgi:hypothetical protein